ncbi:MAG: class I SAM-dependent methyltransferase [Cyanobacteria bacterium J06600_6]
MVENSKRTWYSPVADIYYEARPAYPQALIDFALATVNLNSNSRILEIGSGAGNATVPFARTNASITCVEHNREFCAEGIQNTQQFPNVTVCHKSFEEWQLEKGKYDVVLSANALHQIPSEIAYSKTAAALKSSGHIILLWNLTPELNHHIYQQVEPIYQNYVPSLVRYEGEATQQKILQGFKQKVFNSGYFEDGIERQMSCQVIYTVEQYLNLLSTLRRIEPDLRQPLFRELRKCLLKSGNSVELSFLSAVHVAQKK